MLDKTLVDLADRLNDAANHLIDIGRYTDAERFIDVGETLCDAADSFLDAVSA